MEYIIIFILFAYIAFLHYKIIRKNLFIQSIVNKLSEMEKSWNKEDIVRFLKRLQFVSTESMIRKDKILEEPILNYLFEGEENLRYFIHYTREEAVAANILSEGFKFVDTFYKTAEAIRADKLDLTYKHNLHKSFGKFIVVICISKHTYNLYEQSLMNLKNIDARAEQILTETPPVLNDNEDEIYLFPKQFIKGYINYETGKIVDNAHFNPHYESPVFKENLDQIKKR